MSNSHSIIRVLGIAGSLRSRSHNRGLLLAAGELAPPGMVVRLFERVGEIPHYNSELDVPESEPEAAAALRGAIRDADALLIASPEYNYGIPGLLKNAIDWMSRPPATSVLRGKPAAILGASPGQFGTARGQLSLRQTLAATYTPVLLRPEVFVAQAGEKFDSEGRLIDAATRDRVRKLLVALAEWTRRLS
jgi:chromate reductase